MAARKKKTTKKKAAAKKARRTGKKPRKRSPTRASRGLSKGEFPSRDNQFKRGQPSANPTGRNGSSYRRDAEQTFERLLKEVDAEGVTVSEQILDTIIKMAQAKNRWALDKVLERILPKVSSVEATVAGEVGVRTMTPDAERAEKIAKIVDGLCKEA
jgi:hypothetical protein